MADSTSSSKTADDAVPTNAAIVGGGKGCKSFLEMVRGDTLGQVRMRVLGVADVDPDAVGIQYARQLGVPLITTDYRELYQIPGLEVIIELTGEEAIRDELERTRPRHVRLIDHFGARLFWEIQQAERAVVVERMETQKRVEAERERIAEILDSIPDEIVVVDTDMLIQDANSSFLRHNNCSIDDIRGLHCYEVEQGPRGACENDCPFSTVMREGHPVSLVREHSGDSGETRYTSIVGAPLRNRDGRITGMIEIIRDITARKEAQKALGETREYLQNILDNAPVIIITTDMNDNIVSFNRGAERALGYRADEVIGKPITLFYRDPTKREEFLRLIMSGKVVQDYSFELLRKDGTLLPVSLSLSQLKNSSGEMIGTVGMSKDISHRKALMAQILQSERMAAVGRLASGVAHEINNPLAIISEITGFLSDLTEDESKAQAVETLRELKEALPKIRTQIERGREITHRMLQFARKTEMSIEHADVNVAQKEILPFLEKECRLAGITIHRDCQEGLPKVALDETQLQEILMNLTRNAIDALKTQGGGNIWLETREQDGKVVISVRDDGPGIDDAVRDRLFDPFASTKSLKQGTGLGLAICYAIVKRCDGEIRVFSEPDEGACFQVVLPAHHPANKTA